MKFSFNSTIKTFFTGLIIGLMTLSSAAAQELTDSIPEEDLPEPTFWSELDKGVYLDVNGGFYPVRDTYLLSTEIGLGIQFGVFNFGFFKQDFQSSYKTILIFPNSFDLDYSYGGGFLGLKLIDLKLIESTLQLNYGKGDMTWTQEEADQPFFRDEYNIIHPQMKIYFTPFDFAKLYLVGGWRYMSDLSLSGLEDSDFTGPTIGIGINLGLYNE